MKTPETVHQELFSKKFLIVLLAVSILTNFILLVRLKYPDAKFTVIEYADFQCPYCAKMHEAMKSLIKETDTRWVFRQFPIPGHPLASKAAEASECAGDQGKFWEYSDALFELKGPMTEGTFIKAAQDLGLDWTGFSLCLASGKFVSAVEAQREDGVKNKVAATPTFYLNGKRFDGFVPLEDMKKLMGAVPGK